MADLSNVYVSFRKLIIAFLCTLITLTMLPFNIISAEESNNYNSSVYSFDKNNKYVISEGQEDKTKDTYGKLSISGNYDKTLKDNVPAYYVKDGVISFFYNYNKKINDIPEDEWHIYYDKTKKVNNIDLKEKLGNGVIITQTSKDGEKWFTESIETNAFENVSNRNKSIYKTTDVQLNAGAYYRVIVAYEMEKYKDTTTFLFIKHKNYEYKKYAEVYTFYASNSNADAQSGADDNKYSIGKKVLCDKFSGYYGEKPLASDDIHYGWDLGHFFITGHTGNTLDNENNLVILKNVGDQVTLWFNLEQDIYSLNKDSSMRITADTAGNDQYFETDTQDFGKGALIVRKTNKDNTQEKPQIYTNFLEANLVPGTDTVVQLFEEGDYEVALDYEVTKDKLKVFDKKVLDQTHHYRIFFKFSVRNSNCMVYPLDVNTNEKIINGSYSQNGFYLDLAKSQYLQLNVKKSNLKDGTYDLVEDTEYNQLGKEGAKYTEEGLYEITVTNLYTHQNDVKRIYVGNNDVLKAYAVTGLSIAEIKKRIESGATVNADGTIGEVINDPNAIPFAGLDDEDLLEYVEDNLYLSLINELKDEDYVIEDVSAKYVSKDYLENLEYNSRSNLYFGYDTASLNEYFNGDKYSFTLGTNGETIVKRIDSITDNTTEQIMKNVLIGSGVILVCVTVSVVSAPAAPAVSAIFAASAATGTSFGLYSGAFSGISAAIIRGYQTGDLDEAIKAGAKAGSESFKWGAISGAIAGGAKEGYNLGKATKNGLKMNDVAKIQKESNYPLDVIEQFKTMDEYEVYKKAGLYTKTVNGKLTLVRDINLDYISELPNGEQVTNLVRMQKGYAPIDPTTGKAYQLHHINQSNSGTLAILTEAEHQGNASILNKIGKESEIDREIFSNIVRPEFWKDFAATLLR